MSHSNRRAARLILAVIVATLLGACAVGGALGTQKGTDVSSIAPGIPRSEVERQLGAPQREWTTSMGAHYCLYSRLGDAPPDAGVAAAWLGMDIVTMGITEMVPLFTKQNAYERRRQHPMAVAYDKDDHVIGVFPNATEFDELPADGRTPQPAKE
jgi:hypothetical protein